MRITLLGALVATVAFLAAARYLPAPLWVDALWLCGGSLGLAVALALAMAVRRISARRWQPWAAAALGSGALLARASLVHHIAGTAGPNPQIDFWLMALAVSTVTWGFLALVWGSLAISDVVDQPGPARRARWLDLLAGGTAVIASLYSLAPLWQLLGLRINVWTVAGLFGLALAAYACGAVARALVRRTRRGLFR